MEVLFCIPEDLYSRFEYIPPEALPCVLESLLRKGLEVIDSPANDRLHDNFQKQFSNSDLETILSAIKSLQVVSLNTTDNVEKIKPVIEIENTEIHISKEDDDDELGEFLDMMK